MKHDEVVALFREKAASMPEQGPSKSDLILGLATLLAESRGRLSKENFESLINLGAALYKEGHNQYQARSDVDTIMTKSHDDNKH
ncbi:MAG TPA: hypothetical protein VGU61_11410 [Noviherbaspirillum sp.]|uniref:hypothetical protein n=1 Tax=Noviherbaspirillum sp. TaxID=1926288 RepID=UPI002DDCBE33|nr:hypothetical protein [Noviherbaspirillum sp.]HEV2610866.1 hypothetical protein [Noviherbaspirillum sp.]